MCSDGHISMSYIPTQTLAMSVHSNVAPNQPNSLSLHVLGPCPPCPNSLSLHVLGPCPPCPNSLSLHVLGPCPPCPNSLSLHVLGPCPPCPKTTRVTCYCGRSQPMVKRCGVRGWSCGRVCRKVLSCELHTCEQRCHEGRCNQ